MNIKSMKKDSVKEIYNDNNSSVNYQIEDKKYKDCSSVDKKS